MLQSFSRLYSDLFLFGETPDFYALIGYVIIIGASYYMFEKARRQTAITKQQSNTKE